MAHLVREDPKLCLEMRELWLLTRIRRDYYWFLWDPRGLGPRSVRAAKLTWGRVHAAVALRLTSMQERLRVGASLLSATIAERLYAMRDVLGSRAASSPERQASIRFPSPLQRGASMRRARTRPVYEARLAQAALADLLLPELPASPPPSSFRSLVTRLNPLSLYPLQDYPALPRTGGEPARDRPVRPLAPEPGGAGVESGPWRTAGPGVLRRDAQGAVLKDGASTRVPN